MNIRYSNGHSFTHEGTQGLRVALVEQEDFCAGVSAWSGRLVHGGLRYLEHGDVPLVRESLRERERLFHVAPHLVKPVRLIMPVFSRNTRPSWMIRLGMIAYDVLSFDKSVKSHRVMNAKAVTTYTIRATGTDFETVTVTFGVDASGSSGPVLPNTGVNSGVGAASAAMATLLALTGIAALVVLRRKRVVSAKN